MRTYKVKINGRELIHTDDGSIVLHNESENKTVIIHNTKPIKNFRTSLDEEWYQKSIKFIEECFKNPSYK